MDKAQVATILQVLVIGTGIAMLAFKGKDANKTRDANKFKMATIAFLLACTGLVGFTFAQPLLDKTHDDKGLSVMDSSQSEFFMKLSSAVDDFLRATGALTGADTSGKSKDGDKYKEIGDEFRKNALKLAKDAVRRDPASIALLFRELVIAGESGQAAEVSEGLETLRKHASVDGKAAAALLEGMYVKRFIKAENVDKGLKDVVTLTSKGWFRDVATIEVYRRGGHEKQAQKLTDEYHERMQNYLLRIACLLVCALSLGLIGTLLFFGQFFFWPRRLTTEADRALIAAPQVYGFIKIYGVFIGWLALECLCSPLLSGMARMIKKPVGPPDPLLIGLTIFVFYTLNNLPALFIAWFVAIKPTGVRFIDAVKLRLPPGSNFFTVLKLVMAGITAWLCAMPLIMLSAVLSKNMQAQGSSNPILPVISEVVRSDSWFIIFLFVFVLGVVPALCEETLFRGFLYTGLRAKYGVFVSVLISASVFAAIHMDFGAFLQLFILGAVFALVMERTRSLIPSMVAHCLWNSGTLILMMVAFGG